MNRQELFQKHEALREAELHGATSEELAVMADGIDATFALRNQVGDAQWSEAMDLDQQMRDRGDVRPPAERFAEIGVILADGDHWSPANILWSIRHGSQDDAAAGLQQWVPGLPKRDAKRLAQALQLGDDRERGDALRALIEFQAADVEDQNHAQGVCWLAMTRGGNR